MNKQQLQKLIIREIRSVLTEEFIEPSEQVLKGAMTTFKQNTGINTTLPTLQSKSKRYETGNYSIDLTAELRRPLWMAIFKNISLDIEVANLKDNIGGYSFSYSVSWNHTRGGSNGYRLGTVFYSNNKYTWREG